MSATAATIGTFDGVHLGHQKVLAHLAAMAHEHGWEPIAITFSNHPLDVLAPQKAPLPILAPADKKKLIEQFGVRCVMLDFTPEMAGMPAAGWIKLLHEKYGVEGIVLGYDNTFGHDGRKLLRADYIKIARSEGLLLEHADEVPGVSSTLIRRAISQGDVAAAMRMCGRPFGFNGIVGEGNKIGRTIGFATANIFPPEGLITVPNGVYLTRTLLPGGEGRYSVTNVGIRPTLHESLQAERPCAESHLIDWQGNLYGLTVRTEFIKRLRPEQKYPSLQALKTQISLDLEKARHLIALMEDSPKVLCQS